MLLLCYYVDKCIFISDISVRDTEGMPYEELSNSSLTCKPNSTLSWTEKELTLFSHVSTVPQQHLHIALATLAH